MVRSVCASTIAPSAAVISSALVTSNGKTYLVKMSVARPVTFDGPSASGAFADGPMAACPTMRLSRTSRPIPASPAARRWPLIVSTIESAEVIPTIITTNRNSISTAPVYTITWTKARNGAPSMA